MAETSPIEQRPEEISPEELERRDFEKKWFNPESASTNPENTSLEMLGYLKSDSLDKRKMRLFTIACCRNIWHLIKDKRSREAVEVADRFIEGKATSQEVEDALEGAIDATFDAINVTGSERQENMVSSWYSTRAAECPLERLNPDYSSIYSKPAYELQSVIMNTMTAVSPLGSSLNEINNKARVSEAMFQADCLRDIFGNPFAIEQPVIDPTWLTANGGAVPRLAETIYNERSFKDMVVLWDALEEAGCTNEEIRKHCQGDGQHVRGCWVIDLILGR